MKLFFFYLLLFSVNLVIGQPAQVEEISDDPLEAYKQYYIQAVQIFSTDPNQANFFALKALSNAKKTEDTRKIAKAFFLAAKTHAEIKNFTFAYEFYRRAQSLYVKSKLEQDVAFCEWGVATIFRNLSLYDSALVSYDLAMASLWLNLTNEDKARLKGDIGILELARGNYLNAINTNYEALQFSNSNANGAIAHLNIAFCFNNLNQSDSALFHFQKAYRYSKAGKLPLYSAQSLNEIGHFLFLDADYSNAIEKFKEAYVNINLVARDYDLAMKIEHNLARAYMANGEYQKGITTASALIDSPLLRHGGKLSFDVFDLLIDYYLTESVSISAVQGLRNKRKQFEEWFHETDKDSLLIIAAQLATVDERLKNEAITAEQKPLRTKAIWGISIAVFCVTTLVLGYFFLYRPQYRKYRRNKKQLADQTKRIEEFRSGVRRKSRFAMFMDQESS